MRTVLCKDQEPKGIFILEGGTDRLTQKYVINYHYLLHNNPEERSSKLTAQLTRVY